ncbi:OmpA family protein [Nevskia soli]|uniref:OmpA family protein n=1 Tax=Nevskia soli TaxID=418856 RepID=UPI000A02E288|nr:OmpA family protein [Nevskia soli]
MRIRLAPIAAAVLAMFSAAATAQDAPVVRIQEQLISSDYIAILPGYAIPDSGRGTQRNGFTTSVIYGNQFSDHFSIEGNIQGSIFETGRNHGTDFYQWGGTVDLAYSLWDRRKAAITPYGLVGIGALYQDVNPQSDDSTSFVAEAGIGFVTKSLYDGIKLRGEGRYIRDFYHDGFNDYRALIGIEIPLGRVVERVIEVPPSIPPTMEPLVKEVPRPWIDSDGDGVDDEHDLCPNTPHGLKVDAHGCVIPGQTIELNGVTFEFNKARLSANAQTILDTIAPAFIGQPGLRVEIAGHTDSIGSAAANLTLSQKRAEAVRAYLIAKGAKPDQLRAKGYGKTEPLISPERTADDRERNRRVEFRVLDK